MEKDIIEEIIEPTQIEFMERIESLTELDCVMDKLRPRLKRVLEAYYVERIPTKDIAREFGISVGRVTELRYDALRHMRIAYHKRGSL